MNIYRNVVIAQCKSMGSLFYFQVKKVFILMDMKMGVVASASKREKQETEVGE